MTSGGIQQTARFQYAAAGKLVRAERLIDHVAAAIARLADAGWSDLLARHGLNTAAQDLEAELSAPLGIDRSQPGFSDFALEGTRAIEPGQPSRSLLFHAFASPNVRSWRGASGVVELRDFPTPAEIEAVENYVYGAVPPSIEELRARAQFAPLAIVVFASEYRPGSDTVHRRHADMCYSRSGVARIGMREPDYDKALRGYAALRPGDGRSIAVLPARYVTYIADAAVRYQRSAWPDALHRGQVAAGGGKHPPRQERRYPPSGADARARARPAIPIGNSGFRCTSCSMVSSVCKATTSASVSQRSTEMKSSAGPTFYLLDAGHDGGWAEPDISAHPFVITEDIAALSSHSGDGTGLLVPVHRKHLVEAAIYKGKPLTYVVPESRKFTPWRLYQSSLNLQPVGQARKAPEYLHARHVVTETGEENLNQSEKMLERLDGRPIPGAPLYRLHRRWLDLG